MLPNDFLIIEKTRSNNAEVNASPITLLVLTGRNHLVFESLT